VEVWEGGGQVAERAVEGEGAVSKRVGGVMVGHIDFANVEAREDREERGRRGGCLAVVPSEMLGSCEVRREKRREEARPEPCSSTAEAFCMKVLIVNGIQGIFEPRTIWKCLRSTPASLLESRTSTLMVWTA
jgi:hypothetical protein